MQPTPQSFTFTNYWPGRASTTVREPPHSHSRYPPGPPGRNPPGREVLAIA